MLDELLPLLAFGFAMAAANAGGERWAIRPYITQLTELLLKINQQEHVIEALMDRAESLESAVSEIVDAANSNATELGGAVESLTQRMDAAETVLDTKANKRGPK